MESRGVVSTHRLRTLMLEGSIPLSASYILLYLVSYSKFLFLVPRGTNQISHAAGSNLIVLHEMG